MTAINNQPVSIWRLPVPNTKRFAFSNPFYTSAQNLMPRNIKDVFKWAEHLYAANGIVAQCIERVVKYPITDLEFGEEPTEVREQYKKFFNETTDVKTHIMNCGIDLFVYGNSFSSIFFPFNRFLKCPQCHLESPVGKSKNVRFQAFTYRATCRCGYKGTMERIDRRSLDEQGTNYIRWSPHQMDISYNPLTGHYTYYYNIPGETKKRVKEGDLDLVNGLPWNFIEAVKENKLIKFARNSIFHMKMPSLAGLSVEWGMPPALRTFYLHYFVAILRRGNEAVAQDYLTPIRVFFPQAGGAVNDPSVLLNLSQYKATLEQMVVRHRTDPADAYFSPLPIGYQAIGGEFKALNVSQEIKQANEEIMASMGFPQELFYGTMSVQAAPLALRVFENNFAYYVHSMNKNLKWIADKISNYFDWDEVNPSFMKVTLIDDAERKQLMLQLAGSQLVSRDSILGLLGTSTKEEVKKQMDEQRITQELQKEFKDKQDAENMSEDNQGSQQANSLQDIEGRAQQLAQTWLQMPEGQRRSAMYQASRTDPTTYSRAKVLMEQMQRQQKSQAYYDQQNQQAQQAQQ